MANENARLVLKPGRERPLDRFHPWIFSGAISSVQGNPEAGETVEILASDGRWLARAAYSPESQIRARVWTWQQAEDIDEAFFRQRLAAAWQVRASQVDLSQTNAHRVVHAESDGLPGLVLDRYGDHGVLQILTAGAEYWRPTIVACLEELDWFEVVLERSDAEVRALEGLPDRTETLIGRNYDEKVEIHEGHNCYLVDIASGQKTGFYLDQRANRSLVAERGKGKEVLDAFCYSGGFSVALLRSGAEHVTAIDSSSQALADLRDNLQLNALSADMVELREADVFQELRRLRDEGRQFDLIVLDPPKFAPTRQQAKAAARGYKDINLYAFKLLKHGGELFTFSCSGGIEPSFFQKIVAGAAVDADRHARVVGWLDQAADHPVSLAFPEGRYLKGLHCLVK